MQGENSVELGARGMKVVLTFFFFIPRTHKSSPSGKSSSPLNTWETEIGLDATLLSVVLRHHVPRYTAVLISFLTPVINSKVTWGKEGFYWLTAPGDAVHHGDKGVAAGWEATDHLVFAVRKQMNAGTQLVQSSEPQHGALYCWSGSSHFT